VAYKDLGKVASTRGDGPGAIALCGKALSLFRELGDRQAQAETLETLAATLSPSIEAARLYGAAASLRATLGAPLPRVDQPAYERGLVTLRQALGEEAFIAAWHAGKEAPLESLAGEAVLLASSQSAALPE
jgi:hypothetical protein